MNHSESINELATALAAAQGKFKAIPKDGSNQFGGKFASLASVVEETAPVLSECGLSVSQFIGSDEGGDTLTTLLLHKSGQYVTDTMRLHVPGNAQNRAQAQGSAITYARRYSYQSVLGLVADDDDDGAGAASPSGNRTADRQRTKAQKPAAKPPAAPESGVVNMNYVLKPLEPEQRRKTLNYMREIDQKIAAVSPDKVNAVLEYIESIS